MQQAYGSVSALAIGMVWAALVALVVWQLPILVDQVDSRGASLEHLDDWASVRLPLGGGDMAGTSLRIEVREATTLGQEGFVAFDATEDGLQTFLTQSGFAEMVPECAPGSYGWPVAAPAWWPTSQPTVPCAHDMTAQGVVRTVIVERPDRASGSGESAVWPLRIYVYAYEWDSAAAR
jgi:hypothetical protein